MVEAITALGVPRPEAVAFRRWLLIDARQRRKAGEELEYCPDAAGWLLYRDAFLVAVNADDGAEAFGEMLREVLKSANTAEEHRHTLDELAKYAELTERWAEYHKLFALLEVPADEVEMFCRWRCCTEEGRRSGVPVGAN